MNTQKICYQKFVQILVVGPFDGGSEDFEAGLKSNEVLDDVAVVAIADLEQAADVVHDLQQLVH